jgi:V-type H+-transporting ATPase subunit a
MFGDAGHGLLMLMAALFLVYKESSLKKIAKENEIFSLFFGGRYIILLMSLFSIYAGFIYNDFFSKSINLFGSRWRVTVG